MRFIAGIWMRNHEFMNIRFEGIFNMINAAIFKENNSFADSLIFFGISKKERASQFIIFGFIALFCQDSTDIWKFAFGEG